MAINTLRKPLRVLHLLGTSHPGGVETFVLNVAKFLDRGRFELTVCIADNDGPVARELRDLDVRVLLLGRGSPVTNLWRLYRGLATSDCDVLHASIGGRALRHFARIAGFRHIIVHLHGPPRGVAGADPRAGSYVRRALAAAGDILVSSDAMLHWVEAAVPELSGRVERVYYGVDLDSFDQPAMRSAAAALRSDLHIPTEHVLAGFVGRLVPQKGIRHLAAIVHQVLSARSDVHFLIAGDGPLRSTLANVHAAFPSRVHMLGARRDIPAVMTAMDVLVVPSEWEPLGIVCIEAMSAGKAVIAFAVDGIPEVVQQDRTGFLVPAHDCEAFAARVLQVVADASLRERLGEAGRLRAHEQFDARTMARSLERLYEQG